MKPIVKKVLESGLVDKHLAKMMESWGYLEPGASELVKSDALKDATREHLNKLAEELGSEVEKERTLRETQLDLDRLRWPAEVSIYDTTNGRYLAVGVSAVIDRMGRYYFRIQDVTREWFVPGYSLLRTTYDRDGQGKRVGGKILESDTLFIGEQPVCVQVTVG